MIAAVAVWAVIMGVSATAGLSWVEGNALGRERHRRRRFVNRMLWAEGAVGLLLVAVILVRGS